MTSWEISPPSKGGGLVNMTCQGSKNAALPLLFAAAALDGESSLENVPDIGDIRSAVGLLQRTGFQVQFDDGRVRVRQGRPASCAGEGAGTTRYSVLLLAVLLRLCGRAEIPSPGGCELLPGGRPIDIHLAGFQQFGVRIREAGGVVIAEMGPDRPGTYGLRYPSVGATLNLLMFCALGSGEYRLANCAMEPEVCSLVDFLRACGAGIQWLGPRILEIKGRASMAGRAWCVMPDRIEAMTCIAAGLLVRRDVGLKSCALTAMAGCFELLAALGVNCIFDEPDYAIVLGSRWEASKPVAVVAQPYPGFPSDLVPIFASVALAIAGESVLQDTVFPKRMRYAEELRSLGANLSTDSGVVKIVGGRPLVAADVHCRDIRCGAGLALAAALAPDGLRLLNVDQVCRGYAQLEVQLRQLGWGISVHPS